MPTAGNPPKILVSIATYNEIENLPRLVDLIFQAVPQADLLVVDDNSPDGTGRWCDQRGADDPRLRCLHRQGKLGLGTAMIAAIRYAIEQDYDYLINLDGDMSHHPRYLPELIAKMQSSGGPAIDIMIGSRYVPGGGTKGWPLRRKIMSRCVNLYARVLLGLSVKDCSGGLRCYRVSLLKQLDIDRLYSRGYSLLEELLWRLKRLGARFAEMAIVFEDRQFGQSKINFL